jgi:type IV secretory pathway VirJ component
MRLSGNRHDFEGMAIITGPAGDGGREDMDTDTDNAVAQQIVNVIVPTVIKSDEGILTPHCVKLIVDLAAWVQCIYGTSS